MLDRGRVVVARQYLRERLRVAHHARLRRHHVLLGAVVRVAVLVGKLDRPVELREGGVLALAVAVEEDAAARGLRHRA